MIASATKYTPCPTTLAAVANSARLEGDLVAFVEACPLYVVATAPLDPNGHVNCSPRANEGSLRVLSPERLLLLDLVGSSAETVAHLRENGRITIMIPSFEARPRVVRIYGHGIPRPPREVRELHDRPLGVRAVLDIDVIEVRTSCGYGVPVGELTPRPRLGAWLAAKGPEGLARYVERTNRASLDGLVGLDATWLDP
jgi:hypothetical protein